MLVFVGECVEFCLDAWTVSWAYALYLSVVEGRVFEAGAQDVVHCAVGLEHPAWQLLQCVFHIHEREVVPSHVAVLPVGLTEIDRAAVYSDRSAGFHASGPDSVTCNRLGESIDSRFAYASAGYLLAPYVHQSAEECAGSEYHATCLNLNTPDGAHASHLAVFDHEFRHLVLPDVEVGRVLQYLAPCPDEFSTVALCPRAPHRRSFRQVEHTELEAAAVGHDAHHAAQRIHFAHNLTLGNASDSRIARHLCNLVHVHRHQAGTCSHACSSRCGLTASMTRTNHYYVVFECHRLSSFISSSYVFQLAKLVIFHHMQSIKHKKSRNLGRPFPRMQAPHQIWLSKHGIAYTYRHAGK